MSEQKMRVVQVTMVGTSNCPTAVLSVGPQVVVRPSDRDEMTLAEAEAWRAGAAAMREKAAQQAECGCPKNKQAAVVAVAPSSNARWMACGQTLCGAIEAAAIRATDLPEPPR